MSALILFGLFVVFLALGVPIGFSLGASSLAYLFYANPDMIGMIPQRIWAGTNTYVMIALPLFILSGELMNQGGITRRIIDFSLALVRPVKGGLSEVCVVASMIFGGISGSSVADTSAIGSVLIPEMEEMGYPRRFAAGVTVAASTMGMIIPPSIPMLTYAMISGGSVAALFLAGLIPGIMIGVLQIGVSLFLSHRKGYLEKAHSLRRKTSLLGGIPALVTPLIIIGSVTFGIATASESAGVAVFYALLVGSLVYRELNWKLLPSILLRTASASAAVMLVIGFSMIFGWIMALEQIPATIANFFQTLNLSPFWILLLLDLFILFIGTFVDVTPALLLVTPILLPVMQSIGVDVLHFGAIMIVGLAIGLVTPPLGMCLNACTKIVDISIMDIFKGSLPFLLCDVIVLLAVTFFPAISMWLPTLLLG